MMNKGRMAERRMDRIRFINEMLQIRSLYALKS